MANLKAPALRYLLLRHMFYLKEHVPHEVFKKITKSLDVTETEKGFVVKWEDEEKQCERQFNKDSFHFFSRGDLPKTDSPHTLNPEHNNASAKCFATQALKLEGLKEEVKKADFFPGLYTDILGYCLCGMALWLFSGNNMLLVAVMIPIFFTIESWYNRGKVIANFLIIVPIAYGFPFTGLLFSLGNALFHMLDPDAALRRIRFTSALFISFFALFVIYYQNLIPLFDKYAVGLAIIAFINFFWRWTYGIHFRFFPLLFQIIPFGIYIDGFPKSAFIVLFCGMLVNIRHYIKIFLFKAQFDDQLAAFIFALSFCVVIT